MLFNADKCKCVHYAHNNRQYDYFMGDDHIETSHEDLGMIITDKLDVTEQCAKASKLGKCCARHHQQSHQI